MIYSGPKPRRSPPTSGISHKRSPRTIRNGRILSGIPPGHRRATHNTTVRGVVCGRDFEDDESVSENALRKM